MIGKKIKKLAAELGYTQKQLAVRSGCTEASISRYINNTRMPTVKVLKRLSIALGVSVEELI